MQYSKEKEMKKGLILTIMLVSVLTLGYSQTGSWNVTNVATWVEAIGAIRSGGNNKEYVITVNGNISVPSSTENTFGSVTGITITIQGSGTLSPSANGSLLYVGTGQTIVARDLTLRGRNANNASVVRIENAGTFRMEGRATITGNSSSRDTGGGVYVAKGCVLTMQDNALISGNTTVGTDTFGGGGGVRVVGGTFTMYGGTISNNIATLHGSGMYGGGGGVNVNDGIFSMLGDAKISGNTTNACGGGVFVFRSTSIMQDTALISDNRGESGGGVYINGGNFTMQGGTIISNTADYSGGGVDNQNGIFTMQDGTISNNTATDGGGVHNGIVTFTMQDGMISNNAATNGGGVYNAATFTMQGGTISGNTVTSNGGGVYITSGLSNGKFTIQGGKISGNTTIFKGGGVYFDSGNWTFTKTGGTIYGDDADQNLKNTVITRLGHVVYNAKDGAWRNASAGPTINPDSYGFWLNDGEVTIFPSSFAISGFSTSTTWKRSNFNNTLTLTENTIKSSSSNYLWILQRISGNAYTFKRGDAANTLTLTIRLDGNSLVISGDSGNGQDNWNGTWVKQR